VLVELREDGAVLEADDNDSLGEAEVGLFVASLGQQFFELLLDLLTEFVALLHFPVSE
jgi:hypothetical protein